MTASTHTRSWQHRVERRDARQAVWSAEIEWRMAVAKAGAVAVDGSDAEFAAATGERQDAAILLADVYDKHARAWHGSVTYWAMKSAADGLRLQVRVERQATAEAQAGTQVTR